MTPPPVRGRRLLFVTGKGGVGKTTVAAGLARSLATSGQRVLLCSIDGRPDLAEAFGLSTLKFAPTKVDDRLSVMAMDTEASLREYLKIYLRVPVVGRLGPMAAAFDFVATAAPGVREILTIGKLCYEVRERHYDTVVVDAPATGHIVSYLGAPAALRSLVRVGPILSQTDWMAEILADERMTGVIVVTTAEEMPVRETTELLATLVASGAAPIAAVVANKVVADLFVPRDAELVDALRAARPGPFAAPGLEGLFDAATVATARRSVATEFLAVLREGIPAGVPIVIQPLLFAPTSTPRVIADVARSLGEELS